MLIKIFLKMNVLEGTEVVHEIAEKVEWSVFITKKPSSRSLDHGNHG